MASQRESLKKASKNIFNLEDAPENVYFPCGKKTSNEELF